MQQQVKELGKQIENREFKTMENKIILYQNDTGKVSVSVMFQNESFWLTQRAIAELFGVEVPAISKHLKNIFESGELKESSVVSKMEITAADGKNYLTTFTNRKRVKR